MAAISSLGIGSGLDIQGLVAGLVEAEGAAKDVRLTRKEAVFEAKLSALSAVKSALSDFQDTFSKLRLTSTFNSYTAASSSTSIFTASASNGASEATYDIEVNQLAQSQKLVSTAIGDKTATVGTGTLVVKFGTYAYDGVGAETSFLEDASNTKSGTEIAITDGSMEGIRDAINDADIGVTASIINSGSGYQLIMSSETGEASAINVTVKAGTDSDGNEQNTSGLSAFAYDPTDDSGAGAVNSMSYTQTAEDASLLIDGVNVRNSSNTITDVIEDVTLNLKDSDPGVTKTLAVARNTSGVESAVQDFVDGYNTLMSIVNQTSFYDSENGNSGILIGDPTVRGVVTQVRNVLNNLTNDPLSDYNSLASIGILTARDGTFEYDATKLSAALANKPDDVKHLLAGGAAKTSDLNIDILSVTDNIGAGIYGVNITQMPMQGAHVVPTFVIAPPTMFNLVGTHSMQLNVDGVATNLLSLANSNYYTDNGNDTLLAGQAMAADLQTLINSDANLVASAASVVVAYAEGGGATGQFTITSNKYGSSSSVEVTTSATGLSTTFNINVDAAANTGVSGVGTIGGEAATFDGQSMTGTGLYAGFVLNIIGGSVGERSGIEIFGGNINSLNNLLNSFLDSDGFIAAKSNGLNASIDDIQMQRENLTLRLEKLEARYIKQFSAMDALVARLNSTSNFLSSQLDSIANISIGKK